MSIHPDIKIGSILKDNDPRIRGRTIKVDLVFPNGIGGVASNSGERVSILDDRIHCDGKWRKTGFSLVRDEAAS